MRGEVRAIGTPGAKDKAAWTDNSFMSVHSPPCSRSMLYAWNSPVDEMTKTCGVVLGGGRGQKGQRAPRSRSTAHTRGARLTRSWLPRI